MSVPFTRSSLTALVILWSAPVCLNASPAPVYRVARIAPANDGRGKALGIDDRGDVAGFFNGVAFVYRAGTFTSYPGPKHTLIIPDEYRCPARRLSTYAYAVRANGEAVGDTEAERPCGLDGSWPFSVGERFKDGKTTDLGFDHVAAIDARGDVAGTATLHGTMDCDSHGEVLRADGAMLTLTGFVPSSDENSALPMALDDDGDVAGEAVSARATSPGYVAIHAFYLHAGATHERDLGAIPGYADTVATAVSNAIVVGYSGTRGNWFGTTDPQFSALGSMALDRNERLYRSTEGCVLAVTGPSHAWVWTRGHMTDLSGSLALDSGAFGVNDSGIVVGYAGKNAVRWVNRRMQDLNALIAPNTGWHLEAATGINRAGVIVGFGSYRGRGPVPFRLTPGKP